MKILISNKIAKIKNHLVQNKNDVTTLTSKQLDDIFTLLENDNQISMIIINDEENWKQFVVDISSEFPNVKIVVFAKSKNAIDIKYAYKHNVASFIPDDFSPKMLKSIFEFVIEGGCFYPPEIYDVKSENNTSRNLNEHEIYISPKYLTNRQGEVLEKLYKGLSNKQIAYEMNVTESTVKLHIKSLLRSLNARNRTHAVMNAIRLGIKA